MDYLRGRIAAGGSLIKFLRGFVRSFLQLGTDMSSKSVSVRPLVKKDSQDQSQGDVVTVVKQSGSTKNASIMDKVDRTATAQKKLDFSVGIPVSTSRIVPRSTAINACYAPSSLYRNTTASASSKKVRTPHSARSLAVAKTKQITNSTRAIQQQEEVMETSNLIVAVRVRPLNTQECSCANVSNVVQVRGNELTVLAGVTADSSGGVLHSFNYDFVFNSSDPESVEYADQKKVFTGTARSLIDGVFEGYNACLFAYGQTGSGKSYSMMGIEALDDHATNSTPHPEVGIIPRFCRELFKRINNAKHVSAEIEISYFEIYNEKIHDLLTVAGVERNISSGSLHAASTPTSSQKSNMRPALKVREHPIWGPYVVDLSVHPVDSYETLRNWLIVGNSQRATAATGLNEKSSRSHSIFNIVLNLTNSAQASSSSPDLNAATQHTRRSRISLVDLAGSERIAGSGNNGDRIREGVSINKSLLTLGKVIAALAEAKKIGTSGTMFVPYRESVLTWLLRENLGGNSKTVMLATISPANINVDETLATLRYASQARSIVNRVKVNESPHDKIIRELRAEVDRLKSLRNEYERQRRLSANINPAPRKIIIETSVDESEVNVLRQQLAEREKELNRAQKSWMERLNEAEQQRQSEIRLLRRKGLALELSTNQKHACLVNLTADPILSGTLFYILPPGQVKIGRTRTSDYCSQPDIVLDGPLVAYHHCIIENLNGQLYIIPENKDFETYVNGDLVHVRQQIFHGDRLVIGGTHYFRISNPFCTKRSNNLIIDFQMAHEEILHKQEDKLRRELEEEKQNALSKIESERAEDQRNFHEKMQKLELEHLKYKCNREILETERKAFLEEAKKKSATETIVPLVPSFQSRLLENIKSIMQNPSEESLHKTQLMVKEATQRCRNFGLKMQFHHSQKLDEFGMLHSVILLKDIENGRIAEWPIARLGVWLDIIRDGEDLNGEDIFKYVDINWKPLGSDRNESFNESFNSSRISLNFSIVKDALRKKPPQKQLIWSPVSSLISNSTPSKTIICNAKLEDIQVHGNEHELAKENQINSQKHNSYADIMKPNGYNNFTEIALAHIGDMQRTTLHLKMLYNRTIEERENSADCTTIDQEKMRSMLIQLENILQGLQIDLQQNVLAHSMESSASKIPKAVRFLVD